MWWKKSDPSSDGEGKWHNGEKGGTNTKQSNGDVWKLQITLVAFPMLIYPTVRLCVYSTSMSVPRAVEGSENTDTGNVASTLKGPLGQLGIKPVGRYGVQCDKCCDPRVRSLHGGVGDGAYFSLWEEVLRQDFMEETVPCGALKGRCVCLCR